MTKKKSLLWKVTSKNGGAPSYIFGTMHVRDLRAFGWLELALSKMDQCSAFATEFDFSEADPVAMNRALELPEGTSLKDFLPRGAWKRLKYFAKNKLGLEVSEIKHLHPMSISTMFSNVFMESDMSQSLDETLYQAAQQAGKRTTGVETFQDQIDTLNRIPFAVHIKGLSWFLKNQKRQKKRLKKMMEYYAAGEIQAFYKAAKKDAKGMRKALLYRRNYRMTKRFIEITKEETLFCAIGAGHLAGGKGMLRLLKKAGYKVEAIT